MKYTFKWFQLLKRKAIPAAETSPVITKMLHWVRVLLLTVHVISETSFPLHLCCCVSILTVAEKYAHIFPSLTTVYIWHMGKPHLVWWKSGVLQMLKSCSDFLTTHLNYIWFPASVRMFVQNIIFCWHNIWHLQEEMKVKIRCIPICICLWLTYQICMIYILCSICQTYSVPRYTPFCCISVTKVDCHQQVYHWKVFTQKCGVCEESLFCMCGFF